MADYQSQFTGPQIDQRLAAVTDKQDRLVSGTNIKTVGGQSILGIGDIPIQAGDTNAVQYVAQELTEAQKQQARANINAASLADIQDMDFVTATERPTASASTMGHIYLIGPDANNNYDRYYTQESNGTYSWVSLGSTQIDLSTYATKAEVSQLQQEVHNLSGKYYGLFTSSAVLPSEITQAGYAFVGSSAPFAIWNFDGSSWSDTGATVDAIHGEDGVGFASVASQQDGTIVITLTNGDTVTIDLNHNHPQYPKYQELADEAAYEALATKESDTLYLIPE